MNCEACGHENLEGAHFCAKCGVQLTSMSADGGSWIGRLVGGRFRVIRVLGEGGMGIVYEGEQQMGSTVRRVAIKTLHPHLSNDPSVLARFHRECGTVSELEHPNTIKFYDFGKEADGTLYIAMEFLDGRSLDQLIQEEGAIPPTRAVKILRQICGALDEAHEKGVIHRDLKPENVVLTERLGEKDFVKLLDFGIAARSESTSREKEAKLTQQGMVLGTPPYMSPEQFTGEPIDCRSDVYSLGVMAYEMLTAQLPFHANTPWQWATEHMTAQPFPIDQVPSGAAVPRPMRDAVMRALAKIPDERPQTAGAFLKELEAALSGAAAVISAPTEQMQAVPGFAAGPNSVPGSVGGPSSTGPSSVGGVPYSVSTQSEMSATQGIQIPTKKSAAPKIVAVVALLGLAAGATMVLRGKGKTPEATEEDPSAASALPTDEPPPEEPKEDTPDPTTETEDPAAPDATASPAPGPAPAPSTTPRPTGPNPKDVCAACVTAAAAGNWAAAASEYGTCSDVGKAKCSAAGEPVLSNRVSRFVNGNRCTKAEQEIEQASAISAVPRLARVAVEHCDAKKPAPKPDPKPAPKPAPKDSKDKKK
jgi:serine/threonine protein kinase